MDRSPLETPLAAQLSESQPDEISVLHVDDNEDFSAMTATFLEREHPTISVTTATTTNQGLSILESERIDCVVSDFNMPDHTGLDFLELIRESHADLPFILFTGRGSEEIASDAISRGVTDYMQKETGTDQFAVLANRIEQSVRRYRMERSIDYTHERFRLLVEESTDVIILVGSDGLIEYASPSAEFVLGRTPAELIGTNGFDPIHPDDQTQVMDSFNELASEPDTRQTVEFRYQQPDDTWIWVEARGRNLLNEPILEGILVHTRDITEHKTQQESLAETTHRLRAVVEASPLPIVAVDTDGKAELWNSAAEELFGWTEAEVIGEPYPVVPDRKRPEARGIVDRVMNGTQIKTMQVRRRTKVGTELDLLLSTAPVYDAADQVIGVMSVFSEIPERERILEALHDAVRDLIEASTQEEIATVTVTATKDILGIPLAACWLYNDDHNALEPIAWTEEATEVFGELPTYSPDNPGLSWGVFEAGSPRRFDATTLKAQAVTPRTRIQDEIILPLGSHGVLNIGSTTPNDISEQDQSLAKLLANTADTALSRATQERELQDQRERFESVFEKASDAMVIADDSGQYIDVNQSACDLFGYDKQELLGRTIAEFAPDDYEIDSLWSDFKDKGEARGTFPLVRADGSTRMVAYAATTNIISGQHLSILRDIDEEITRRNELQRQNERLNEFASIVSHDLRNPLNILRGSIDLAEETGDLAEFERSRRAIQRMESLIEDLLALAREGEMVSEFAEVSIPEIVRTCWESVDTRNAGLRIETDRIIRADRSRLRQLVENLIRNAVEHGGSDVVVTVGGLDSGFYVSDTGSGVSATDRDRIFEPGFSTQPGGTGYGLAIVAQIAEAHHWDVAVTTGCDGGARFEITSVTIVDEETE